MAGLTRPMPNQTGFCYSARSSRDVNSGLPGSCEFAICAPNAAGRDQRRRIGRREAGALRPIDGGATAPHTSGPYTAPIASIAREPAAGMIGSFAWQ
jgi:hypothetical protein